jgi:hypothetical protein
VGILAFYYNIALDGLILEIHEGLIGGKNSFRNSTEDKKEKGNRKCSWFSFVSQNINNKIMLQPLGEI